MTILSYSQETMEGKYNYIPEYTGMDLEIF